MNKLSVAQEVYDKHFKNVDEKYEFLAKISDIVLKYLSNEMTESYEKCLFLYLSSPG
jgi:hypothetical protein